jgi:hypothetical protein
MKLMENTRLTKDQIDNLQHRLEGWLLELCAAVLEVARQGRQLLDESALDVADRERFIGLPHEERSSRVTLFE